MDLLDKKWTIQVCHIYRKENECRDWLAIQDLINCDPKGRLIGDSRVEVSNYKLEEDYL